MFDVDLAEGETVIKVKVTAQDTTTTETYVVTVTRVDFLVSNLGQTSRSTPIAISGSLRRVATQFTTGGNIPGYKISEVRIPISIDSASLTILVSIYSDVSGEPGSSVKPLTHPASITVSSTETTEVDFDAGDQKLEANTPYWIVVDKLTGTGDFRIEATRDDPEDPGSAPGWSIGNVSKTRGLAGSQEDFFDSGVMQIAVKGKAIKPAITLAADFDSIIRDLHEVTFTLTRAGSTALAADVTLMVENATGDSVVSTGGRTETLTFAIGDNTVEFAMPEFWVRTNVAGSFVATVEAGPEYDTSGAIATVEVVHPSGTLIEVSLDKTSYRVTEGDDLTFSLANVAGKVLSGGEDTDVVGALTVGIAQGFGGWAVWAQFTWMIGATILKTEKTEADWEQLARATGFAHTPGLLNVLYFVPTVGGLISLVAFVWTFACMLVAVRQSLDYTSTWRAFFVILLALIPVLILNGIAFLLVDNPSHFIFIG